MALSKEDIQLKYPLPVYNYKVTVLTGDLTSSSTSFFDTNFRNKASLISCTEISGLQMELDSVTYRDGLSFTSGFEILPSIPKEIHLSIRKGVTLDGDFLSEWMKTSYPSILSKSNSLRKRDLLIDLCDAAGFPLVRWTVRKAMPLKLQAPSFKADANEVAFEQLDLIAHELSVEYFKPEV